MMTPNRTIHSDEGESLWVEVEDGSLVLCSVISNGMGGYGGSTHRHRLTPKEVAKLAAVLRDWQK